MYIILPDSLDGLDNLIDNLNPSILSESIKNMTKVFSKVVLPKFNFEYTSVLAPLLKKV
jgi:serine protease inhibitor